MNNAHQVKFLSFHSIHSVSPIYCFLCIEYLPYYEYNVSLRMCPDIMSEVCGMRSTEFGVVFANFVMLLNSASSVSADGRLAAREFSLFRETLGNSDFSSQYGYYRGT